MAKKPGLLKSCCGTSVVSEGGCRAPAPTSLQCSWGPGFGGGCPPRAAYGTEPRRLPPSALCARVLGRRRPSRTRFGQRAINPNAGLLISQCPARMREWAAPTPPATGLEVRCSPTPRCRPTPPRWLGGKRCTAAEEEGPAEEQASSAGDNLPVKAPAPERAAPPPPAGELRDITPMVQAFRGVAPASLTRQNIDIWIARLWSDPFISLSGMNRAKRK